MVLVRRNRRGWSGSFPILITSINLQKLHLKCINFLSLSDTAPLVLSTPIPAHASGKQSQDSSGHWTLAQPRLAEWLR